MHTTAEKVIVSAQIHSELREKLLRRAVEADRSLSAEIRRALAEHVYSDTQRLDSRRWTGTVRE
jgi:hypothetical protein